MLKAKVFQGLLCILYESKILKILLPGEMLFMKACSDRTSDTGFKWKEARFILGIGKTVFMMSMVRL